MTQVPSLLNRTYSFLQVTRTTIKALMSWHFGQIPSPNMELGALEHLNN